MPVTYTPTPPTPLPNGVVAASLQETVIRCGPLHGPETSRAATLTRAMDPQTVNPVQGGH